MVGDGMPHAAVGGHSDRRVGFVGNSDFTMPSCIFRRPDLPRPGPSNHRQRLRWAGRVWEALDGYHRDVLVDNLKRLVPCSGFTGLSSFGQILLQITTEVNRHVAVPLVTPREFHACEIDDLRFNLLRSLPLQHRPLHMSKDICSRWPASLKHNIDKLTVPSDSPIAERLKAHATIKHTLFEVADQGELHCGSCELHPKGTPCFCMSVPDSAMTMMVGSVPCKDWSAQKNSASAQAGSHHIPACAHFAEARVFKPDLLYTECTPRYLGNDQVEALPDSHTHFQIVCQGSDYGDCYNRPRFGGVSVHGRIALIGDPADCLEIIGCESMMSVSDFWMAPAEWHRLEKLELAEKRVLPVFDDIDDVSWFDLLLPSMRDRLEDYMALFAERQRMGLSCTGDNLVCDLEQQPKKRPRTSIESPATGEGQVMTVISHQTLWNIQRGYPLLSLEIAQTNGWPITEEDRSYCGCLWDFEEMLRSKQLTCKQLVQAMGDGWNLMAQGCWIMWLLSNTRFRSELQALGGTLMTLPPEEEEEDVVAVLDSSQETPQRCSQMTVVISEADSV